LGEEFLDSVGFTDVSVHSKIMRLHRVIRQCWHNRQYNSFGPQKESILKSSAFSTRLLLEKFDAPSVINWYECLASTCEAFRIGLVPFGAIQFGRRHEGLCLPGLGFERYDNMASALCTAMPICLDKADGRVRAMVSGVETKRGMAMKLCGTFSSVTSLALILLRQSINHAGMGTTAT
jgi:hypothetical protein